MEYKCALSIAGSDPSGGAGIQADLKTMTANGVYAMGAITSLTAQNTLGVRSIYPVPPSFLREELKSVFEDIFPQAVKIGMTGSKETILTIDSILKEFGAKNVVVDPVMVSSSGKRLLEEEALPALKSLFLRAELITPNLPEAEVLWGKIRSKEDAERAAKSLFEGFGASVLIKGGHRAEDADDLLYIKGRTIWLKGERIETQNTHGTGCALSSAIAANLAKGYDLLSSVERGKAFVRGAMKTNLSLGKGVGPLDYLFDMSGEFAKTTR